MADEQNRITENLAAPGSAVRQFHIGNTPQIVPPDLNTAEEQSLEQQRTLLKVPSSRPPFGTDDEGNPRPDPSLTPAEEKAPVASAADADPRASRKEPAPTPDVGKR